MKVLVFFFVLTSVCIVKTSGLFCFHCKNKDQPQCKGMVYLHYEDCPDLSKEEKVFGLVPVCTRTITKFSNKTYGYNRSCQKSIVNGTDFCTDFLTYNKDSDCNTCMIDFCNGANDNLVKFWMFVIAIIVVMYMKHQF